ncbi:hypothetical protein H2248_009208 [Termitomyces sp. 'cryptogamus']|nr:hypothetical protein H2248_009208 [Termitomyces sp. 'cryptogamus']
MPQDTSGPHYNHNQHNSDSSTPNQAPTHYMPNMSLPIPRTHGPMGPSNNSTWHTLVTTHFLDPCTLPNNPLPPQNLPQCLAELPQCSAPTLANFNASLANSNGPLANSDVFPAVGDASPGSSEPLVPFSCHA